MELRLSTVLAAWKDRQFFKRGIKMKYAVIITYSFDHDYNLFTFGTEEEACEALKKAAKEEFRIETEENEYDADLVYDDDWWFAKIITHWDNDDEICYYHVARID